MIESSDLAVQPPFCKTDVSGSARRIKKETMYIKFYPIIISRYVQRLFYIHTGFNDRSLLWIVNGKIYDFLFIKIR